MKLQRDLREFVELLNSRGVEFLVVGGHAVAYHGHPRFTGDIDFFLRPSRENAERVIALLSDFGFAAVSLTTATFTTPGEVVQLGYPPNRIDLLTSISGLSFEEAWASREEGLLDGLAVAYIGLEDLLRNKAAAARPKDTSDLATLRSIHGERQS